LFYSQIEIKSRRASSEELNFGLERIIQKFSLEESRGFPSVCFDVGLKSFEVLWYRLEIIDYMSL